MTVSWPAALKAYVKAQAAATGCSTPSECIRRLIHGDQRTRGQEELERRILEGIDSPARDMSEEGWQALRSVLQQRLAAHRNAQ